MSFPKVSVLMPVYNSHETHLREAIESILNQTFTDFEFIIVNDASPNPNVEKIILSYTDPRIRYSKNPTNLNVSATRNRLLDEARGEYLAIFDHDDISLPTRLEKQVAFLDAHPEIGVLGTNAYYTPSGAITSAALSDRDIRIDLMGRSPFIHPTVMIRKKILEDHQIRYDEQSNYAEDYDLWCQLIPHTQFANINEILVHYRDHHSGYSKVHSKHIKKRTEEIWNRARHKHPDLWREFQTPGYYLKRESVYKLFRFLPIWKSIEKDNFYQGYLFAVIPILCRKTYIDSMYPVTRIIPPNKSGK